MDQLRPCLTSKLWETLDPVRLCYFVVFRAFSLVCILLLTFHRIDSANILLGGYAFPIPVSMYALYMRLALSELNVVLASFALMA